MSIDKLFSFVVSQRTKIITVFKIFFLMQITFLFIGARSIYYQDENLPVFYRLGVVSGRLALIFYIITTIPGITRRFDIKHKAIATIMFFRRYIGTTMFLFVLIHYLFIRGINVFLNGKVQLSPPLFEVFGFTSFLLLLPLFLTSSDLAVKLLGHWWFRLHKLTYVAIGLIFLHIALQRLNTWSILIGITLLVQLASHIYGQVKHSRGKR